MSFLKNPIDFQFTYPAKLTKSKYNYRVHSMNLSDLGEINRILYRLDPNLKLPMAESYMNGKFILFKDDNCPSSECSFIENEKWKLKIQVQGYKSGPSGRKSPIMRITVAQFCFLGNLK